MNNPTCHLITEYEYGAFFYVPEEVDPDCEPDLTKVLKYAQQNECFIVNFDNLADTVEDLPIFDW